MGTRPDSIGSMPHPQEPSPDLISAASAAVLALSDLARFPDATDAARRALVALYQLGPVVSHLPSAGEGATERVSARNVDITGGPIATGVEHSRDSLTGGSRVTSSHDASIGLSDNVSNEEQHNAWCGICQVGCNSFQILDQHKIGKRHKKNLQRIEELKRVVCVSANMQEAGTSGVGTVVEGEAAMPVNIDFDPEIGNGRITNRKSNPCKKRESNENRTIAKRAKNVVALVVCSVCNIKCDTLEVFDKHLSGKKHISKVKHSQLRQPINREIGLQSAYLNHHQMSQVAPSQGSDCRFLIPEGSYLPPLPQLPQVHYQVDTAGNASVGSFPHPGALAAIEAAVSLQGSQNISPTVPRVQRW